MVDGKYKQEMLHMKIAVVGSGARGNVLGGLLAQAGEFVTLIDPDLSHVTAVEAQGLWIDGAIGHLHVAVRAQPKMTERPDVCLLCTPIQDIMPTLQEYKPLLNNVPVVTLQDSPHAAELAASVLGKQYILSAVALFSARLQPGRVSYPVAGSLLIGEPFDSTGFAESLVAMFNRVIQTMYVDNIHGAQWTKLITTLHLGLAAATGLSAEQAAEHPVLRPLAVSVMKEATDVTNTAGIQLQSLPELPPVNKMVSVLHMPLPTSEMIPRLLSRVQRDMLEAADLVARLGHEGEIVVEYINGEVAQLGRQIGLLAPYNEAVVKIIQELAKTGQRLTPEQLLETIEVDTRLPSRTMTSQV
jgi:2-dehydropantoate 2-reductase